jgi:hypothetical protein
LGLTLLAALFPKTYEVRIINEVIEEVDFDAEVDLVGITALTCVIKRAYAIADGFRERGVTVILGGVHPSLLPEEAKEHADSVFIGEGEGMLDRVIQDFEAGELKPFYKNREWSDLRNMPLPRRDLLNKRYRPFFKVIETTRGCPNRCEFCSVPIINGRRYRLRSLEEIDRERELFLSTTKYPLGLGEFLSSDKIIQSLSKLKDVRDLDGFFEGFVDILHIFSKRLFFSGACYGWNLHKMKELFYKKTGLIARDNQNHIVYNLLYCNILGEFDSIRMAAVRFNESFIFDVSGKKIFIKISA